MSNIRFTEMGTCYTDYKPQAGTGKFQSCAWGPDDCQPDETFLGTDQNERIMKKCKPSDQPIGRCLLENECALRASDCRIDTSSSNFNATDATCTIQRDKAVKWDTSDPQYTQFGSCKDTVSGEHFCIYNPSDCDESGTEVYATPSETLAAGIICDCAEVHLGVCVRLSGSNTYCAISEQGCRDDRPYYSPHTQRVDRESGVGIPGTTVDCRLCSRKNTEEPTPGPTMRFPPTPNPTSLPTSTPTIVSVSVSTMETNPTASTSMKTDKGLSGNTGAIIGGSVAGVVLLGVLGYFYVRTFKGIKQKTIRHSRKKKPPTLEIYYSQDSGS